MFQWIYGLLDCTTIASKLEPLDEGLEEQFIYTRKHLYLRIIFELEEILSPEIAALEELEKSRKKVKLRFYPIENCKRLGDALKNLQDLGTELRETLLQIQPNDGKESPQPPSLQLRNVPSASAVEILLWILANQKDRRDKLRKASESDIAEILGK